MSYVRSFSAVITLSCHLWCLPARDCEFSSKESLKHQFDELLPRKKSRETSAPPGTQHRMRANNKSPILSTALPYSVSMYVIYFLVRAFAAVYKPERDSLWVLSKFVFAPTAGVYSNCNIWYTIQSKSSRTEGTTSCCSFARCSEHTRKYQLLKTRISTEMVGVWCTANSDATCPQCNAVTHIRKASSALSRFGWSSSPGTAAANEAQQADRGKKEEPKTLMPFPRDGVQTKLTPMSSIVNYQQQ